MKITDLKLPEGGSDGQVLKKQGETLVWANDEKGSDVSGITQDDADKRYVPFTGTTENQKIKGDLYLDGDRTFRVDQGNLHRSYNFNEILLCGTDENGNTVNHSIYPMNGYIETRKTGTGQHEHIYPIETLTKGTTDTTNKRYAVKANTDNSLYVDVPWEGGGGGSADTDTKNTAGNTLANDSTQYSVIGSEQTSTIAGSHATTSATTMKVRGNTLFLPVNTATQQRNNKSVITLDSTTNYPYILSITNGHSSIEMGYDASDYISFGNNPNGGILNTVTLEGNKFIVRGDVQTKSLKIGDGSKITKLGTGLSVGDDGALNCTATGGATVSGFYESDRRLKENIASLSDVEKLKSIEFKEFNFKKDEKKRKMYGVIAQELEEAGLENLVNTKEDGFKSVDYVSLLVLAMQEMRDEIKSLKDEIAELKK